MSSLGRPLNLGAALKAQPKNEWQWLPGLDLLCIVLVFGLLASRFIAVPGVEIALPRSDLTDARQGAPAVVLTVSEGGFLYAGSARVDAAQLALVLTDLAAVRPPAERRLLLKLDRTLATDDLLALLATAREAGFAEVHLATSPAPTFDQTALGVPSP